jgi:hypothetical protein
MEQSHSSKANSVLASHETPRLLQNPKGHYCVHKCPKLVPILSQMHPFHNFPLYFPETGQFFKTYIYISIKDVAALSMGSSGETNEH